MFVTYIIIPLKSIWENEYGTGILNIALAHIKIETAKLF